MLIDLPIGFSAILWVVGILNVNFDYLNCNMAESKAKLCPVKLCPPGQYFMIILS